MVNLLSVRNLKKMYKYKNKTIEAVRDISFEVNQGEIIAFLGPNGAGKTTTIKSICGLFLPTSGEINVCGYSPKKEPHKVAKKLGVILEGNRNILWKLDVVENIEYFAMRRGIGKKEAKKIAYELTEKLNLKDKIGIPTERLSRGMQQKVALGASLAHKPQLLLLDEPTLGLDYEASQFIVEYIKKLKHENKGILITTHQLDIAEKVADRILIIDKGKIIIDKNLDILKKEFQKKKLIISFDDLYLVKSKLSMYNNKYVLNEDKKEIEIYFNDSIEIYEIMEILKPLKINKIHTHTPNLEEIFISIRGR
ncbi:ABC transporter ATP-binding protein [Marinitoga litoralis]|uniref:ABC transporter ATP-binding protein n=1 Tax=Marinitoga litoralis TaxID=570855 RepID=UPI00196176AF|nr:ABC transporter ATP-binding protein [Marinitoga litoralis]MBM7559181.1 ABC-2 type transport system ATP-binding protein [Marinitoga litoralis]